MSKCFAAIISALFFVSQCAVRSVVPELLALRYWRPVQSLKHKFATTK